MSIVLYNCSKQALPKYLTCDHRVRAGAGMPGMMGGMPFGRVMMTPEGPVMLTPEGPVPFRPGMQGMSMGMGMPGAMGPMGMGMPRGGMGAMTPAAMMMMGGPRSMPMGGPMAGPMGGSMGGFMGGPMGGPMGGSMGGAMGGLMGGPMGMMMMPGRMPGAMGARDMAEREGSGSPSRHEAPNGDASGRDGRAAGRGGRGADGGLDDRFNAGGRDGLPPLHMGMDEDGFGGPPQRRAPADAEFGDYGRNAAGYGSGDDGRGPPKRARRQEPPAMAGAALAMGMEEDAGFASRPSAGTRLCSLRLKDQCWSLRHLAMLHVPELSAAGVKRTRGDSVESAHPGYCIHALIV